MRTSLLLPTLLLMGCAAPDLDRKPITVDELRIDVSSGSREIGYTNKEAGFYYTQSNAEQTSGWHGWHVFSRKILDDYLIQIDGTDLKRSEVILTEVYPHQFRRIYASGLRETVTFLDSVNALIIELDHMRGRAMAVWPLFRGYHTADDFDVDQERRVLLVRPGPRQNKKPEEPVPRWIALLALQHQAAVGELAVAQKFGTRFAPAGLSMDASAESTVLLLVAGHTKDEALDLSVNLQARYGRAIADRAERMERVLNRAYIRTNDADLDKALHWALLSLDALIMNQGKKGIFAGLPWFSNYWGRDSFISLPGATLVTGQFRSAKQILQSFAEWQDQNEASETFGRIPNLVTPASIIYNTTDGTPWFIIALADYVSSTGDTLFARELFPVVRRSVEGAIDHHTDRNRFLTHGDAETWMDAVGPDGPWSPRGNCADDVQALWYRQLMASAFLAEIAGHPDLSGEWRSVAADLKHNFSRLFIDATTPMIVDHLNADGSPDKQFRPNQLFALRMLDSQPALQYSLFRKITKRLVYPYGVASLWQEDEDFHPYHHYEPYYVPDAAYHNGIVWTWLAGPWIQAAVELGYPDIASVVTLDMTRQILERGGAGTLSELLDALPRPGEREPRTSGTFTQAWSLAEFLATMYRGYCGATVDVMSRTIDVRPRLPESIHQVDFNVHVADRAVRVVLTSTDEDRTLHLEAPADLPMVNLRVSWMMPDAQSVRVETPITPGEHSTITFRGETVFKTHNNREVPLQVSIDPPPVGYLPPDSLSLAVPELRPDLKALAQPSFRLLSHSEVKRENSGASVVLDIDDPSGDDVGTGTYTYPTTPHLKPGSLDLVRFWVAKDKDNVYFRLHFRALSDPGWHPEYGFQLTYAAIVIDTDGRGGSGQRDVGMNSGIRLGRNEGYERAIYVGGGIRIVSGRDEILAEYRPLEGDDANPLGEASTGVISFSVPVDLIGSPTPSWRFHVLIGAQDDHGGAGIGEFRSVGREAEEWAGGGKKKSDDPNVYDVLRARASAGSQINK